MQWGIDVGAPCGWFMHQMQVTYGGLGLPCMLVFYDSHCGRLAMQYVFAVVCHETDNFQFSGKRN
jgi:hypothetical protein